ncbi:MAG: hypothetical protein JSU75_04210 [Gammaproteobacteria bacterium]|nr:MAG: hypothetical protein JSU75_04210 [Gammaproteobacteria bacterium]
MNKQNINVTRKARSAVPGVIMSVVLTGGLAAGTQGAWAGNGHKYCSATAKAAFRACENEVTDDYWIAQAICINVSDDGDRAECEADAREAKEEDKELCSEQRDARMELCSLVGEERYDPDFDPTSFVDPDAIGDTVAANPYFPLIPGTTWVYEGGDETITVVVTDKTKLIDGVTCRVVNDVVEDDGEVIEDTDDWYAQHVNGDVWYCGELARDFETFEGDNPDDPELVEIEGSFKAGRDGDKPGILMPAVPQVGDVYRQEVSLGNAEDAAEVISLSGTEMVPAAECNNDCLITRDFTPLEPGIEEYKYHAPGVGMILEVDMEGNRVELVEVTTP